MIYEKKADEARHFLFEKYHRLKKKYDPLPHFHSSIEIYIVTEGSYIVSIGGDKRILKAGDVAFVDRFVPHTSGSTADYSNTTVYVIVASSEYFGNISRLEDEVPVPFTNRRDGYDKVRELTELAWSVRDKMDDAAKAGFLAMIMSLIYGYSDKTVKNREKSASVCVEIMKYISENYAERITLDSLAERYGYERTYLSRLLNRALGMNLREYLNRVRISAIINMKLKNPDASMSKLAQECGFESENTYYRALKKYGSYNF